LRRYRERYEGCPALYVPDPQLESLSKALVVMAEALEGRGRPEGKGVAQMCRQEVEENKAIEEGLYSELLGEVRIGAVGALQKGMGGAKGEVEEEDQWLESGSSGFKGGGSKGGGKKKRGGKTTKKKNENKEGVGHVTVPPSVEGEGPVERQQEDVKEEVEGEGEGEGRRDPCPVCGSVLGHQKGKTVVTTTIPMCQHTYHSICLQLWIDGCRGKGWRPKCAVCFDPIRQPFSK